MEKCRNLPNQSFVCGTMPVSCVMCQQGAKMVLLVTGKCGHNCYYCPLSLKKQGKPDTYANEKLVQSDDDIIFEAESIEARGTGITGGDPFLAMKQTIHFIELLKGHFGTKHNIHLYTATPDLKKISQLAEAGLDEIRFHPPPEDWPILENTKFSEAISHARNLGLRTGIEIPCIPGKEKEMVILAKSAELANAQFINLNELEFSESNWQELKTHGFQVKDDISSSVKGSQEAAGKVAKTLKGRRIIVHYCSSSFKDATQLRNRIIRRAKNTATKLEIITEEGTFIKGVIETKKPREILKLLKIDYEVPSELVIHDVDKSRIEIAAWILEDLPVLSNCEYFIVEEYPTADRLEVEKRPVN